MSTRRRAPRACVAARPARPQEGHRTRPSRSSDQPSSPRHASARADRRAAGPAPRCAPSEPPPRAQASGPGRQFASQPSAGPAPSPARRHAPSGRVGPWAAFPPLAANPRPAYLLTERSAGAARIEGFRRCGVSRRARRPIVGVLAHSGPGRRSARAGWDQLMVMGTIVLIALSGPVPICWDLAGRSRSVSLYVPAFSGRRICSCVRPRV
jgi:hypothetical protein